MAQRQQMAFVVVFFKLAQELNEDFTRLCKRLVSDLEMETRSLHFCTLSEKKNVHAGLVDIDISVVSSLSAT